MFRINIDLGGSTAREAVGSTEQQVPLRWSARPRHVLFGWSMNSRFFAPVLGPIACPAPKLASMRDGR